MGFFLILYNIFTIFPNNVDDKEKMHEQSYMYDYSSTLVRENPKSEEIIASVLGKEWLQYYTNWNLTRPIPMIPLFLVWLKKTQLLGEIFFLKSCPGNATFPTWKRACPII